MMEDPIPVEKHDGLTADDVIKVENARHGRRMQWLVGAIFGVIILSLFVPLGVWLTRLAMGG